jgi:hypothetical protein
MKEVEYPTLNSWTWHVRFSESSNGKAYIPTLRHGRLLTSHIPDLRMPYKIGLSFNDIEQSALV